MSSFQLIADSGATKTEWRLLGKDSAIKTVITQGISPYFLSSEAITALLQQELLPQLGDLRPQQVHYYGTGCANAANIDLVRRGLYKAMPWAEDISVDSDLLGAARSLCGQQPGVACILGTGSNSCVFNGAVIEKNNPAPGFILGDEGSGAYLGKKLVQYFIYNTLDEELMHKFNLKFNTDYRKILQQVYKEPMPNRYLASFAPFLSENRGHYMVENIIEDGLSDFFFVHLYKYSETWTLPVHFTGSIAWHFRDVVEDLCNSFELQLGRIQKEPMDGLVAYHQAVVPA